MRAVQPEVGLLLFDEPVRTFRTRILAYKEVLTLYLDFLSGCPRTESNF